MQTFRLEGLPSLWINDETRRALEKQDNKSKFVRNGILAYAKAHGFNDKRYRTKPSFMLPDEWEAFLDHSVNARRVDYTYLIAFAWLRSQPRFNRLSNGKLLRKIITESNGG